MSSILTNNGAMVALQTMKSINKNMGMLQSEISTGKSVATAKDNAAVWAISKTMESDVSSFKGISDSLSVGNATLGVARAASETVTKLLTEMRTKIVAAQAENVDRVKIQTDIDALQSQIETVVGGAQFNGLNLVNGSETSVNVLSSLNRSSTGVSTSNITVTAQNLSTSAGQTVGAGGGVVSAATVSNGTAVTFNGLVFQDGTAAPAANASTSDPTDLAEMLAGDSVSLTIGSVTGQYVIREGDTADSVTTGLRNSLASNGLSDTDFTLTLAAGEISIENNTNVAADVSVSTTRGTGGLSRLGNIDVTTVGGPAAALQSIEGMLQTSINAAAAFGSVQKQMDIQSDFVGQLADSLKSGIGAMVDANMEEASARLQALQVQQQLATQALSIANQAPQNILALFR